MKIIPRNFSGWTTPSYGGRTKIQLPTGPTYHELIFGTNLTPAQILWVNVMIGTETIVRCKGTDLKMLEDYKGIYPTLPGDGTTAPAVNELVLAFADLSNLGVESRNFTSLVTSPGEQLSVELEIGAPVLADPGDDPAPITLKLSGEVSANDPRGRRWLPKLLRSAFNAGQLKNNNWNTLQRDPHRYYRRLHLEAGDIENIRIEKDRVFAYERDAYRNVAHLKRNLRHPQAGYHHIDFIASDFGRMDMFHANAMESLEFFMDKTATGNVEVLIESVDDLHPEWDNA